MTLAAIAVLVAGELAAILLSVAIFNIFLFDSSLDPMLGHHRVRIADLLTGHNIGDVYNALILLLIWNFCSGFPVLALVYLGLAYN